MSVSKAPRRSRSGTVDRATPVISRTLRGMSVSSGSSSISSYTLQTPHSPSILAVLDLGKRARAGSSPVLGYQDTEPFEDTFSHRESMRATSADLLERSDGIGTSNRGQRLSGGPDTPEEAAGPSSPQVFDSEEHSRYDDSELHPPESLLNSTGKSNAPNPHTLRAKRSGPSHLHPDGIPSDQSDDSGAKQGRRLRPRLRNILSTPLTSSRRSSRTSISKIASALSSRKPSVESDFQATLNHPPTRTHVRQDSQASPSVYRPDVPSTRLNEDTIWIQRKPHPVSSPTVTKSPIPAKRSIPPTLQRGITSPIPALAQLSDTFAVKDPQPKPRPDHFERILPKELKVMIMSKLLESGATEERDRRWSGEVGARRELIRLSRVSKSWRTLCFDGQLWANVDLAPFAAHLHPRTIRHLFSHTAPFTSHLSFRGMSASSSKDILSVFAKTGDYNAMATLTTLDLRCSSISSRTINAIIQNAPRLRSIDLKGCQAVIPDFLHCLASYSKNLESLDVSGCWNISIEDVRSYIDMLDGQQAAGYNLLRLAGVCSRSEAPITTDLLDLIFAKLSNLQVLSFQGCRQIPNNVLIDACESMRSKARSSAIRHLNISGCRQLRADIFPAMSGLFPELRYLELAGIPALFQENSQSDRTAFNRFLETLPNLEKLDIEETCGTCIDDSTLKILARAPHLTHLQIGFASKITPEGMIDFTRDCPTLRVFGADNTQANGAVIREFQRRHPDDGRLSVIDCRTISAGDYLRVAGESRPREGFAGYAAIPMAYSPLDLHQNAVIKAFWSWRRVSIPRGWRETLAEKERELAQSGTEAVSGNGQKGGGRGGRGRGWRRRDESYDAKGLCVVQ